MRAVAFWSQQGGTPRIPIGTRARCTPNPLRALTNPRLMVISTALKPLVDGARNYIVDHARQRLQPKVVALAQKVAPAPRPDLMVGGCLVILFRQF